MTEEVKTIDISGLHPFALGNTGECYRLDEDKILKLYFDKSRLPRILAEKKNAVSLLRNDIPTAISYDVVSADDRIGIIFEMIDAKNVSETIVADGSQAAPLGRDVARLAREIHRHIDTDGQFDLRATQFARYSTESLTYVGEEARQRIYRVLDELDSYVNYVHGDFHPNNILVRKDGLYLIDLAGFCHGCPAYDVGAILFSFFASPEASGEINTFNGLSRKQRLDFWYAFSEEYFGQDNRDILELLPMVLLLKRMNFEQFSGWRFPEEYRRPIRNDVINVFENGEPCPALPV